jgi:hypothetical protein
MGHQRQRPEAPMYLSSSLGHLFRHNHNAHDQLVSLSMVFNLKLSKQPFGGRMITTLYGPYRRPRQRNLASSRCSRKKPEHMPGPKGPPLAWGKVKVGGRKTPESGIKGLIEARKAGKIPLPAFLGPLILGAAYRPRDRGSQRGGRAEQERAFRSALRYASNASHPG